MISLEVLLLFFVTTLVVVLAPGPAVMAVTAEAASNGFKRSVWVMLGISVANVVFFILSATGIATLIIASHTLFAVVKWIGVGYLLYIGLGAIFSDSSPLNINPSKKENGKAYKAFLRGFVLEMSNPKAIICFSALLPQFIDISNPIVPQLAILCFITIFIDLFCYSLYGYLGYKLINVGIKPSVIKFINRSAGSMLIFAGIKMTSVERP